MSAVRGEVQSKSSPRAQSAKGGSSGWLWMLAGVLLALLLGAAGFGVAKLVQSAQTPAADAETASGPRVGQFAPDFALPSTGGDTIRLTQYRGQPVMVNFWASWCPPCKAEMPDIEKAYRRHQSEGLVVLGVNEEEDAGTVRQFVKDRSFSWTFLTDENGAVGATYRANALPTSYFVDRTGKVRAVKIGAIAESELETKLAQILAE